MPCGESGRTGSSMILNNNMLTERNKRNDPPMFQNVYDTKQQFSVPAGGHLFILF